MNQECMSVKRELDNFVVSENNNKAFQEKLSQYERMVIEKYAEVSQPYKCLLSRIQNISKEIREKEIADCDHEFERFSEYHNDRYYICRKCQCEKY